MILLHTFFSTQRQMTFHISHISINKHTLPSWIRSTLYGTPSFFISYGLSFQFPICTKVTAIRQIAVTNASTVRMVQYADRRSSDVRGWMGICLYTVTQLKYVAIFQRIMLCLSYHPYIIHSRHIYACICITRISPSIFGNLTKVSLNI